MKHNVLKLAYSICEQRYSEAKALFAAGSFIRGEETAFSDLDLVVVYESLPNAYRESFRFDGIPVEAFVHDPQTLNYFFLEVDRPSGVPALPQMVQEGVEIPSSNSFSRSLKDLAASVIAMGPPPLTSDDDRKLRYSITDLLDDIRDPRSYAELVATGGQLFEALANYYLRRNGLWSAKGKSIPRVLARAEAAFAEKYRQASERLFRNGDASVVIGLAEDVLQPHGGLLFEGYRGDAPAHWRKLLK